MNLKRYIDRAIMRELKRHNDIDKAGVVSAYNKINKRIASEIRGGKELSLYDNFAFQNKIKSENWDGVYAQLKGLIGFLKEHKRYEPDWAKSPKADDLIREIDKLANEVKRSFNTTL